jgi:hypothetical protein
VDESGGSWGTAIRVPGLAALSAGVFSPPTGAGEGDVGIKSGVWSLSCKSTGNCAAGGEYADSAGHAQAFVVDGTGGSWGTAEEVPGTAALNAGGNATIGSVSCASAGNCAAGGSYTDSSGRRQAFVVDETGGSWGMAQEVPGTAALNAGGDAQVNSVSCPSAGNCAAGGLYEDSAGDLEAFVVDESGGSWGMAQEVPGLAALSTGVLNIAPPGEFSELKSWIYPLSCGSAGDCAAGGVYVDSAGHVQVFVVDETRGSWGTAEEVPGTAALNTGGSAWFTSVSCPSAGNCAAGGLYVDSGGQRPFVVNESGGSWGTAEEVPGVGSGSSSGTTTLSVSCGSAGNCVAGGNNGSTPFLAEESGGSWGKAQAPPALATGVVWSVSCASAANCAAAGMYAVVGQAFVVDEKPSTSSVLAMSAAKVTYGKEQAERVSVAVSAPSGATPSGTVTLKAGTTVVCGSVDLSAGRASCTVPATRLPAGTWHLTASYSGSAALAASTSAAQTLTVAKAASKVTLSLSAAKVTYGHEQSERLTVKVTGQYAGTPGGKVTVKSGTTTVCTITLASGKGSCTPGRQETPRRHPRTDRRLLRQ